MLFLDDTLLVLIIQQSVPDQEFAVDFGEEKAYSNFLLIISHEHLAILFPHSSQLTASQLIVELSVLQLDHPKHRNTQRNVPASSHYGQLAQVWVKANRWVRLKRDSRTGGKQLVQFRYWSWHSKVVEQTQRRQVWRKGNISAWARPHERLSVRPTRKPSREGRIPPNNQALQQPIESKRVQRRSND